jgi:hypothetical protein
LIEKSPGDWKGLLLAKVLSALPCAKPFGYKTKTNKRTRGIQLGTI